MTNTISNTRNVQTAAEIDLSDFNRSYIVGNAVTKDGQCGILMFGLHIKAEKDNDGLITVYPGFALVKPIPATAMNQKSISRSLRNDTLYTYGEDNKPLAFTDEDNVRYLFQYIRNDAALPRDIVRLSYTFPSAFAEQALALASTMMSCRRMDDSETPVLSVLSLDVLNQLFNLFRCGFAQISDISSIDDLRVAYPRLILGMKKSFDIFDQDKHLKKTGGKAELWIHRNAKNSFIAKTMNVMVPRA